jgi:hypothetical protein
MYLLKTCQKIIVLMLIAASLSVAVAHADDTRPVVTPRTTPYSGPTYTLRYKYIEGETLLYTTSVDNTTIVTVNAKPTPFIMHMDMNSSQTCSSVNHVDGSAVVSTQIDSITGTVNGNVLPMSNMVPYLDKPYSITVSATGGLIDTSSLPSNPMLQQFSGEGMEHLGASLPTQAVAPGDTWTVTAPFTMLNMTLSALLTLKDVRILNNDRVAEIDATYTSVNGSAATNTGPKVQSLSGTSIVMLDLDRGILDSMSVGMNVGVSPGQHTQGAPVVGQALTSLKMSMSLVGLPAAV